MTKKKSMMFAQMGLFLVLGLSSFADETVQVTLILHLAKNTSSISMLLLAGFIGAICAGPIAPHLLHHFKPARTVPIILLFQAIFVAIAAMTNQFWSYITIAFALGCTSSLFWSSILVTVPDFANNDHQLDRINRIIQTVRNLGYIVGPLLGGVLYGLSNGQKGLFALSIMVLCAALITTCCFKSLKMHVPTTNMTQHSKKKLDLTGLLRKKKVVYALAPLIITIILTSTLSVLLIVRMRTELNLSGEIYGVIASMSSLGLVVGPLCFSSLFHRFGNAAGASLAAATIGFGIFCLSLTQLIWLMMLSSFIRGSANGVQNALMASFMMKAIRKEQRNNQMPAYIFIIQTAVCIGFISAGFVKVHHTQYTLLIISIATMITGILGFIVNRALQKKEGDHAE
ncbi:MFS transporter [Bartonella krasnovii]|uniref:MFS transporter n=1 Tax=Bartonella krasnovii TaxID=2267275 RepID=A0A5B9D2M6_9HYPH|nr:MFS transporter [Bartonella krasnovii]QEE12647.1 MFS transporter [Bartonella krasnovii]UNF28653.1 MFS transporter [Bartonella krasnovii]UNF35029.1 MFS transporter [Bartonella krasnovii]UNF38437.1 MFS transporter [Bartonella krasnovii]UNF40074.1 MFS transporter [Bartonella krasnovii]